MTQDAWVYGLCPECLLRCIPLGSGQFLWHINRNIQKYATRLSLHSDLQLTASDILDFSTPEGLRFHVSSLSSPNFATSYTLGSIGLVDGSLSYLYSSLPLSRLAAKSSTIDLHHVVPGYRQLQDLRQPDEPWWWEVWHQGKRIDRRG